MQLCYVSHEFCLKRLNSKVEWPNKVRNYTFSILKDTTNISTVDKHIITVSPFIATCIADSPFCIIATSTSQNIYGLSSITLTYPLTSIKLPLNCY